MEQGFGQTFLEQGSQKVWPQGYTCSVRPASSSKQTGHCPASAAAAPTSACRSTGCGGVSVAAAACAGPACRFAAAAGKAPSAAAVGALMSDGTPAGVPGCAGVESAAIAPSAAVAVDKAGGGGGGQAAAAAAAGLASAAPPPAAPGIAGSCRLTGDGTTAPAHKRTLHKLP